MRVVNIASCFSLDPAISVTTCSRMQLLPLPVEDQQADAKSLAWDAELRRQEEMGRKLCEDRERAAAVTPEPEYAI